MKLNYQGRQELRKTIREKLESAPYNASIHLDKELLEQLLFERVYDDANPEAIIKMPVWYGHFLRKLDLSEVDFEDVTWNPYQTNVKEYIDKFFPISGHNPNFSYTNAKPDFSKSYEAKKDCEGKPSIAHCDFSGMDLSYVSLDDFKEIKGCDLSYTCIKPPISLDPNIIQTTTLTGIDLSKVSIDAQTLTEVDYLNQNDYSNTGLSINYDSKKITSAIDLKRFSRLIQNELLTNCFINGKKILDRKEKEERAKFYQIEYEQYQKELTEKVIDSIDSQIILKLYI